MTNQEIIDGLKRIRFFNQRAGRELWNDKDKNVQDIDIQSADKILSEAIKALEQEPCTDLCKSCDTKGCIFQSGIKREKCNFYTSEKRKK